ncbi:MAG: hypothetical protein AB7O43_11560 [Hyphomicrobiaceae bacterium]
MNTLHRLAMSMTTAAAIGLMTLTAQAQPATPPPAPAAKTTPAKKAPAKKTTRAATKPATSPCKGLKETACKANAQCRFIAAAKRKDGKMVKAYCRLASKPKAKKVTPTKATKKN